MTKEEYIAIMDSIVAKMTEAERCLKEAKSISEKYQKLLIKTLNGNSLHIRIHCLRMPQQQADRFIKDINRFKKMVEWDEEMRGFASR